MLLRNTTRTVCIAVLALMLLVPAPHVFAQNGEKIDVEEEIKICSEIVGRIERLICFDELARRMGFISAEQAGREEKILEKFGFWEVVKRKAATGEDFIYLKNNAAEEVQLNSGMSRLPTLVIMCKHGKTDVYLDWKSRLSAYYLGGFSKFPVVYQFDSGQPLQAVWELSTDRQAAFVPDPVEFIRDMRKHEKLILQFTPMNEVAHTIVHDISGVDKVLGILVENCYK